MSFSFFLARRFFQGNKDGKRKASTPAIHVATAGVAIGLAVMIVSIFVVKGFQHEVKEKITGFGTHIELLNDARVGYSNTMPPQPAAILPPESYPIVTDSSVISEMKNIPGVSHVQRTSMKMGIIKTEEHFKSIEIKGIGEEYDTKFLKSALTEGKIPQFSSKSASGKVLVSNQMKRELGLKLGDKIYVYFFEDIVKVRLLEICGIYQTNLKQFDDVFIISDLYTVNELNNWSADKSSELEITVSDFNRLDRHLEDVSARFDGRRDTSDAVYCVMSIKKNPNTANTFQWLNLLDFNVWVILIIMVMVAVFTMTSGLLILILERIPTIGLLKSMGATTASIGRVFLNFAALIIIRGMIIGNVLGLGLAWLQKQFGIVSLDPQSYYVDKVPVLFNWWWFIGLNLGTLVITLIVLIIPSLAISRIQPAKSIRFD